MVHGIYKCEYGFVHKRCRCPNDNIIGIPCDVPEKHKTELIEPEQMELPLATENREGN